jgi:hypothetical protein
MVPVAKNRRADRNLVPVKADAFYPQLPNAPPCSGSATKIGAMLLQIRMFLARKSPQCGAFSRRCYKPSKATIVDNVIAAHA